MRGYVARIIFLFFIILLKKRELIAFLPSCGWHCSVCHLLTVHCVGLWSVIVAIAGHTHLLLMHCKESNRSFSES